MNTRAVLFVLILGVPSSVHANDSAELLAARFSALPIEEQIHDNLPKGREQEVLDALAKREAVYKSTLLRINHGPSVERFFSLYIQREGKDAQLQGILSRCASPYVIDELAPLLYKTDRVFFRSWGEHADSDWSISATTAGLIGQIIARAPEFPASVKEWARVKFAYDTHTPPPADIIHDARAWWELNQAALLANQFDQVQVPVAAPAVKPAEPSALTTSIAPPPAPIAPATPAPTPPAAASALVAQPPAKSSNPLWWIVGAIAALVALVWVVARKKKPQA